MRLEVRASEAFVRRLDAFAAERGMNRSQAMRAAVLEASPAAADDLPPAPDRDELLRLLGEAARGGSVTAAKVLLEEQRRASPPRSGSSFIDDLASRRDERFQQRPRQERNHG